jgi:23S rRNA (guanosine2251-2'-O)-methyltransferase
VTEGLVAGEAFRTIHIAENRANDAALRTLLSTAKERNIPVKFERRGFFDRLPLRAHQGVVAVAPPFPYVSLHELLARRRSDGPRTLVVLDHLTDPHNVGAILRTAEAAGADGMVLPARRSAGISATVRKAASGAAAHLPVARVANIGQSLRVMKQAGVWVVGADASATTELGDADLNRDVALVIGAEGTGVSQLVKRECDYLVRIPMRGRVGSLNASVAAAILLYEALRQRECSPRP